MNKEGANQEQRKEKKVANELYRSIIIAVIVVGIILVSLGTCSKKTNSPNPVLPVPESNPVDNK